MRNFGVHSEVGKLRTVMVCRPGLAHQRLTPGNCHDLLFDDVIWVQEARKDHYDFVLKMQERGVEVLELHDLLAETLEDRRPAASSSTAGDANLPLGLADALRPWLDEMPAEAGGAPHRWHCHIGHQDGAVKRLLAFSPQRFPPPDTQHVVPADRPAGSQRVTVNPILAGSQAREPSSSGQSTSST